MRRWPIGIALALGAVVAIQILFAVVAVSGSDPIDPSYAAEAR